MKSDPRGARSFDVLNLFADLLGLGLHVQDLARGGRSRLFEPSVLSSRRISCVRKSSVLPTDPFAVGEDPVELVEVARQALELLGDVGPVGGERRLLLEAPRVDRDVGKERADPLAEGRGEASRPSASSAARTGSSSAISTSGCISSARTRCCRESRSRTSPDGWPLRWGSRRTSCPRPTTGCVPGSRHRPASFRSRSGSSRAVTATTSTPSASKAKRRRARSPRRARAGRAAALGAEQPVRVDRADPRGRGDPRSARGAQSPRSGRQPADRRPRGQGACGPDAGASGRRHVARTRRRAIRRPDRRSRRRRGGRARPRRAR